MRKRHSVSVVACGVLAAAITLAACGSSGPAATKQKSTHTQGTPATAVAASSQAFPKVAGSHIYSLEGAHSYTPKAPPGGTDDYHCTLLNPNVKKNSFIIASHFFPNSIEVHHAILFEVPPAAVKAAKAADQNGKGWTCFGETTLPGQSLGTLGETPWLAAWAPGHGLDTTPKGTGVYFPKGSMVIMQIHYNLLEGDKPVHAKLDLQTVPAKGAHLKPLHLDLLPAPPDIPCPSGVHGPLCNRAASLAETGKLFGQGAVQFVNIIEQVCGRNPSNPPAGDTTQCTWPINYTGKILRVTPHMHLLGVGFKFILNPGTPNQKVLQQGKYNFDYQRSYTIKPTAVHPGDTLEIQCTYNPRLRQQLPQLRKLPAQYVTWGDGSSDEMCLGIVSYVNTGKNSHALSY